MPMYAVNICRYNKVELGNYTKRREPRKNP